MVIQKNILTRWFVLVVVVVAMVILSMYVWVWEGYSTKELDGENANNHSCVKLMKAYPLFDTRSWNNFRPEAKSVAHSLAPGMTDIFMETDTKTVMKGNCVVPELSMSSYNLTKETRGDETVCVGQSEDGKVNVVLPYMNDKVSGCGLVFNKYDANKMEKVLLDLHYLSNEQNEKVKDKAKTKVAPLQNTVNAFNLLNNTINSQTSQYRGLATNAQARIDETQSSYDKEMANTSQLTAKNAELKARFTSTW